MVLKECCSKCGFPLDMPREPILLDNNILSFIHYKENTCEECRHQKDGTTIPIVYKHWNNLCNKFFEEREDLIKFIKHYNELDDEQKKEVCVRLPMFMDQNYKRPTNKGLEYDDVEKPYSWNAVYFEVINNTPLSKVMLKAIDWGDKK